MEPTLDDHLRGLAAPTPAPAGGAAAALALAQAAALALKVVRISSRSNARASLTRAEEELSELLRSARPKYDEDCAAVRDLLARPPEERPMAIEPLIRVPLEVLALARQTLGVVEAIAPETKSALVADVAAAAVLARAAAEISHWNVRNNSAWGASASSGREALESAAGHWNAARKAFDAISEHVHRTLG